VRAPLITQVNKRVARAVARSRTCPRNHALRIRTNHHLRNVLCVHIARGIRAGMWKK